MVSVVFKDHGDILPQMMKGLLEYPAVHPDRAVKLRVDNGRGADHHALRQVVVLAAFGDLLCEAQIIR